MQIARCFRDEDLRADRQPEFTQLDIEMAFMSQESLMHLVEDMIKTVFNDVRGIDLGQDGFQRLTYQDAMEFYGTDKPDLRYGFKFSNVTDVVKNSGFKVFSDSETVKGIRIPNGDRLSNSRLKPKGDVCQEAQAAGAPGLVSIRIDDSNAMVGAKAILEGLNDEQKQKVISTMQAGPVRCCVLSLGPCSLLSSEIEECRKTY